MKKLGIVTISALMTVASACKARHHNESESKRLYDDAAVNDPADKQQSGSPLTEQQKAAMKKYIEQVQNGEQFLKAKEASSDNADRLIAKLAKLDGYRFKGALYEEALGQKMGTEIGGQYHFIKKDSLASILSGSALGAGAAFAVGYGAYAISCIAYAATIPVHLVLAVTVKIFSLGYITWSIPAAPVAPALGPVALAGAVAGGSVVYAAYTIGSDLDLKKTALDYDQHMRAENDLMKEVRTQLVHISDAEMNKVSSNYKKFGEVLGLGKDEQRGFPGYIEIEKARLARAK